MAAASTFNPRESTRPASRFDALREELIKAQRTSQAPPNTQSRESHTTPSTVDRQREDSGASDSLDMEGAESDDGEWEADIDPQNIPALASALWEYVQCPCRCLGGVTSADGLFSLFPRLKKRVEYGSFPLDCSLHCLAEALAWVSTVYVSVILRYIRSHADRYISMLEYHLAGHISDNRDTCEAAGDISHRSATSHPTKVTRGKRRRDDERA